MKREIITITDDGTVTVPDGVRMTIVEIADLFGIYYQTVKRHIRAIEKSGVANGDYSMSCTCSGSQVYPDYYGLEMIASVAFRVRSAKTDAFRKWLIRKAVEDTARRPVLIVGNWKSSNISLN